MAALKLYILKETSGLMSARPLYLTRVTHGGRKVHFHLSPDMARKFTSKQRETFKAKHPHVKGRWVLLNKETERRLKEQA